MMKYVHYSSLKHILWLKPLYDAGLRHMPRLRTWEAAPGLCVLLLVAVSNRSSEEPRLCVSGLSLNPSPLGWMGYCQEQWSLPPGQVHSSSGQCGSGLPFFTLPSPSPLIHTFEMVNSY